MKISPALPSLALLLALIPFSALAGTKVDEPAPALSGLVAQLQQTPGDDALREQVIHRAQQGKAKPTVPEEANRRMARGMAAFETAKDTDGFKAADDEFVAAIAAAPWWADSYFNRAVVLEKLERYTEASKSLHWYLLAAPHAADAEQVQTRSYKLDYLAEQKAKADAERAAAEAARVAAEAKGREALARLEGGQWKKNENINTSFCKDAFIEIHDSVVYVGWIVLRPDAEFCHMNPKLGQGNIVMEGKLEGNKYVIEAANGTFRGTVSDDGQVINVEFTSKQPGFKDGTETYTRVQNPTWSIMRKD